MAQSGRSRNDPTTKVGRNDVLIKVTLLDGEEKNFSMDVSEKRCRPYASNVFLQRRTTAEAVINRVITDFLDIEEKEYFALYYLEHNHRVSHESLEYYSYSYFVALLGSKKTNQEVCTRW